MINFKKEISIIISKTINCDENTIYNNIEIPKESKNGDYSFPCFIIAKELKKSPVTISEEIKEKINNNFFEKIETKSGYLNFYLKHEIVTKELFKEYEKEKNNYGKTIQKNPQNIIIEYSSPNIAKPFHVGHLRSTVIGRALYNIYKFLGYNVISINHLGDYGTQFGKMIEGYKRWGNEYNIEENPIDELTKIYVRINELCKEDDSVLEECRNNFKKLEQNDPYCLEIWNKFKNLSLKEFQRIYDVLNINFDYIKGESFYSDKMSEIIEILKKNNKLELSEGAMIVNFDDIPPVIIEKTNKSTTYATRDLAAILYRARTYNFDKCLYVAGAEQSLHFKQIFEVAKFLNLDEKYIKGLIHIPFGMVRLKTGKMSTREGSIIKLEDILNESVTRAKNILKEKNQNIDNIDDIAKKVGIGSVIFNDLYNSRIKDEVFDWDIMLNFQGETCPYIQYMYVRINSILSKTDKNILIKDINYSKLKDELTYSIVKLLYNFNNIVELSATKNEPYILSRYLIDLSKAYSSFYNNNKVLSEDVEEKTARLYLINIVKTVLRTGCSLLGIEMPDKM